MASRDDLNPELRPSHETPGHAPASRPGRGRRRAWMVIAALVLASVIVTIKETRHHLFPRRFAVVEPGRLYRSGYCEPGPLTRVLREHKIRTIISLLANEPDSPEQQKEEAVARREGVELLRFPMPGDGCGDFAALDAAADAIADPNRWPVLVHCYAGVNRTGAAYVAYRLKHLGWSFEQAMAEAERYGYSPRSTPQMRDHLRAYADYLERSRTTAQPSRTTTGAREAVASAPVR